jgi:hypothetical protein
MLCQSIHLSKAEGQALTLDSFVWAKQRARQKASCELQKRRRMYRSSIGITVVQYLMLCQSHCLNKAIPHALPIHSFEKRESPFVWVKQNMRQKATCKLRKRRRMYQSSPFINWNHCSPIPHALSIHSHEKTYGRALLLGSFVWVIKPSADTCFIRLKAFCKLRKRTRIVQ